MKNLFKLFLISVLSISMFAHNFSGVSASEDTLPFNEEEQQEKYDEVYQQDAELIDYLNKNMDGLLAEGKEQAKLDTEKGAYVETRSAQLGTYGDILVSLIIDSGSSGFAGHAAIVSNNNAKTIESFAKGWSPINKDGVQVYNNTWNKSGAILLRPNNAGGKYSSAASWAEKQVGKPYNWNFFNKTTTSKFYCSQLVWLAWKAQGVDTEIGSIPNGVIAPADLVNSSNTYVVKKVN